MVRTRVGYAGGTTDAPTYRSIGDHAEVFEVDFDPRVLSYTDLLRTFFQAHDPTRAAFSTQYQSAVLTRCDEERELATSLGEAAAKARGGALRTRIAPLALFTRAEDYHQKYRLRRETLIVDELTHRYGSDKAMVDSTAAARINGLLSGYGSRKALEALLPRLGLTERAAKSLAGRVS